MDIKKNLSVSSVMIDIQITIGLLIEAAFTNSLKLVFDVDMVDNVPLLKFSIYNKGDECALITAQARSSKDDIIKAVVEMMNGKVITEIFPPSVMQVGDISVNYWKRLMVSTQDITQKDVPGKTSNMAVWAGYNDANKEVVRLPEGSPNPEAHMVEFFRVVQMGAMGTVVIPMRKDRVVVEYIPPVEHLASDHQLPTACSSVSTAAMAVVSLSETSPPRFAPDYQMEKVKAVASRLDHVPHQALCPTQLDT